MSVAARVAEEMGFKLGNEVSLYLPHHVYPIRHFVIIV